MSTNYTHQVTATPVISVYEADYAKSHADLSAYVASGNWTQAEMDSSMAHKAERLASIKSQGRLVFSQHKSLKGAQRGLAEAQADRRFTDAQIEG